MKNFISKFKFNLKVGKSIAIFSFFAFAVILSFAPRQLSYVNAEAAGCQVFTNPVFDPFTPYILYEPSQPGCSDFAPLAAGVHGSGVWSNDVVNAQAGDEVTLRVYIHNGAFTNGPVMHDVKYNVNVDGSTGSSHVVTDQLTASNAAELDGQVTINTPANAHLEYEPGTDVYHGPLNKYIGDKPACFDYSESFYITVKVVANTPPAPTGNKSFTPSKASVCNADGTVNGNLVWTNTSDITSVKITVTTNGNTTQIGSTNPNDSVTTNWLVPGNSYTFTEYDQSNNVIGTASETIDAGICGGTVTPPPANSTVNLNLNASSFCVYSKGEKPNDTVIYTVNGSTDLAGQQIAWSSTKNGASTGEVNANYGQTLDGSGNWTQTASRGWAVSDIGSWTKTVSVLKNGNIAATSQPFSFTVKDCSTTVTPPPSNSTVALTANSATFCVYSRGEQANDTIDYFVTGSPDLAGQQIAWSSTKNGASTGEVNANYGQTLDSSAHYAHVADSPWTVGEIGSWTKTVIVLKNGQIAATSQPFAFTVKDCSKAPTVNSSVNLNLNASSFCVYSKGEKPNDTVIYTVNGSTDLAGQQIAWSSTKNGASTGEVNANYGQTLDGSGNWTQTASRGWAVSDIGSWTKTVSVLKNGNIAATSQPFSFTVKDCSTTVTPPTYTVSLSISNFCVYSKGEKPNDIPRYTVIANSNDLVGQKIVWSGSRGGESNDYYGQTLDGSGGSAASWSGLASRAWTTADLGAWTKTVSIYQNNAIVATSQPVAFTVTDCSTVTPPPATLICSANTASANVGDSVLFTATGGNGTYTWTPAGNNASSNVLSVSFSSPGAKTVSVTSGSQTANCGVTINTPVQTSTGNCNNSSNSCNNNTNNNTQTGGSGSNSSNQSNQNNINGNNNTVTNTNNNCVNNSCNTNYSNTVYITSGGSVVPANQYAQLSITKSVRSINNGGSFQNSVSVNNGDTVQFEIVVTNNNGSTSANNVRLTDSLPSGLSLVNGTVQVNGSNVSDNNLLSGMYLGTLANGQSARVDFQARVNTGSGTSIQNVANATSDNAGSVQASAWVFINGNGSVLGGNVNLTYSKTAINNTKNADATSVNASREDYITYTLTVSNSGNIPANNFIITDDLSQVLPYADIVDNGGGNVSGNTISYPGITVPAGGSVSRSFQVRVKYALASNLSYVMTNTYGNTLNIRINNPQVLGAFVAPKTGADTNAFLFSGILTGAAAVFKKRKSFLKLIFT